MISEKKLIELYTSYKGELFAYLYRFTGSRESAEDLLHDCFVKIIQYSEKKEINEKTVRAFLYRTAHNMCVNQIIRSSRILFSSIETGADISSGEDILSSLEFNELNDAIYSLVQKLDSFKRSIFIMKKEMGMNFSDIAENTGKSERTIRRQYQGVIEQLKKALIGQDLL